MRLNLNTLVLLILAVLLVIFLIPSVNRNTLTAGHTVSVPGVGTFLTVPIATWLIVGWLVTALIYTLINSFSRLRSQADSARLLREMDTLRNNLDRAEGSRFAELQTYLDRRLNELQAQVAASGNEAGGQSARVDRVKNELAAEIGRLDGYLRRKLGE